MLERSRISLRGQARSFCRTMKFREIYSRFILCNISYILLVNIIWFTLLSLLFLHNYFGLFCIVWSYFYLQTALSYRWDGSYRNLTHLISFPCSWFLPLLLSKSFSSLVGLLKQYIWFLKKWWWWKTSAYNSMFPFLLRLLCCSSGLLRSIWEEYFLFVFISLVYYSYSAFSALTPPPFFWPHLLVGFSCYTRLIVVLCPK